MASNRHLGRVIVLQSLYEYELRTLANDPKVDLDIVVAKNIEPYEKALGDTEFVYNLARNVVENFETLDKVLAPLAPEWPIATIAAIDRNVLRMGLYELSECRDSIPPKVAINEAVELAKEFGSENSSRFVNGVLGTAYRQLGLKEEEHGAEKKDANKAEASSRAKSADGAARADETKAADETEVANKPEADGEAKTVNESEADGKAESVDESEADGKAEFVDGTEADTGDAE